MFPKLAFTLLFRNQENYDYELTLPLLERRTPPRHFSSRVRRIPPLGIYLLRCVEKKIDFLPRVQVLSPSELRDLVTIKFELLSSSDF